MLSLIIICTILAIIFVWSNQYYFKKGKSIGFDLGVDATLDDFREFVNDDTD